MTDKQKELPCPHCGQDMHIPARYNATNIATLEQRVKRYETTLKEIDASFHESARVLSHIGRVTVNALAETEREALAEEEA